MKGNKAKWWVLALVVAGGAGWYFFGRGDGDKAKGPPAQPVSVASVARQDVAMDLSEVGNVIAYETVAVRARLDSQVTEVKFRDGDEVKKGDLLFVLDDRTLKAQVSQLEANLRRDQAQLENLRQQFERSQALTAKGFETAANLDEAKAAYKAQQAIVGASQASLESTRVQLGYTAITAPISGRTGTINVTTGNTVKANDTQPLVTINQIKPIRVQMALSQSYFDALRGATQGGREVTVSAARQGSDEASEGKLEYIDNGVDQTTGTFVVRAAFANEDEKLWPGMFVNATLHLGTQKQAMVVPEVAVQHGQAGDFVFVIADNKALRRDIKVERMQDNLAVIKDGLQEGEQVAVDGIMSLKEGTAVVVKEGDVGMGRTGDGGK